MRYTTSNFFLSLLAIAAVILSFAAHTNAYVLDRSPNISPSAEEVVEESNKLEARVDGGFCVRGWNRQNFRGNSATWCGSFRYYDFPCTNINNDLLNNHLFSVKATKSPSGGVWLWPATGCRETGGKRAKWVDKDGWRNVGPDPAYYSMSWSKPVYHP